MSTTTEERLFTRFAVPAMFYFTVQGGEGEARAALEAFDLEGVGLCYEMLEAVEWIIDPVFYFNDGQNDYTVADIPLDTEDWWTE